MDSSSAQDLHDKRTDRTRTSRSDAHGTAAKPILDALFVTRRAIWNNGSARLASIAAAAFGMVLVDDPSVLEWLLFWTAVSLAALVPRHGLDDALAWSRRLGWQAMSAVIAPLKDAVRLSLVNQHRELPSDGVRAIGAVVALPLMGGGDPCAVRKRQSADRSGVFADCSLDPRSVTWRTLFAFFVVVTIGASLRPSPPPTWASRLDDCSIGTAFEPGVPHPAGFGSFDGARDTAEMPALTDHMNSRMRH
ncbi:hypothetical protein [Sphingomonas sp. PP-F2F-G114-C0414]|uniref:hypothetical protein n=1 Tax=Sphingomonas sp. PP-F2F-G114-C0414 TaxID=2135662 RepID=UPI000EF89A74|nr:hypothetical protein [Sphingomonas sp. PP-F2F-G114-C0414]